MHSDPLDIPDFSSYKLLRRNEDLSGILTTTIVLPALLETLYYVETISDDEELEQLKMVSRTAPPNRGAKSRQRKQKLIKAQKFLETARQKNADNPAVVTEAAS